MKYTNIKKESAGIASKQVITELNKRMPKGYVKLTGHAKRLAKTAPTDWSQTGNLTLRNANGSLDTNPKSLLYSQSNLND
jgi:hypothetical protein